MKPLNRKINLVKTNKIYIILFWIFRLYLSVNCEVTGGHEHYKPNSSVRDRFCLISAHASLSAIINYNN